jgi:heptosyltransferase-2
MMSLPLQPDTPAAPEIAYDCRHFLGDRPCVRHKREGLACTCEHYAPVRERVLVIKLDAMGDVLRTTALLPALARAHPQAAIDWVTRPEASPLLENNPYLSDVIPYGADALVRLPAAPFDRVINLDAGKTSAGLATLARSPRKDGYVLHERGYVVATNPAARAWLEMGLNDDLKRRNRRTYQDIMLEILGLPRDHHHYVLQLTGPERARARQHLERLGVERLRSADLPGGPGAGRGGPAPLLRTPRGHQRGVERSGAGRAGRVARRPGAGRGRGEDL